MILSFPDVITADEQRAILAQVSAAEFVDGRETASSLLAERKNNQQLQRGSAALQIITDMLLAALRRHDGFCRAVYPKQLHSLLVSRYRAGMHYGPHVDRALMGDATLWRTDLSLTLFLNEPDAYDGGELALESGSGVFKVKLPARALVCYPTGQVHQVLPVSRGERLVVVAWIQSHVREAHAREVLCDLATALELMRTQGAQGAASDLINKTHANLLRRWAEP
ncbi:MAG: Fe2+-dependent dioxygenase [Dokdonella sp.]